jgi:hypothetical protein
MSEKKGIDLEPLNMTTSPQLKKQAKAESKSNLSTDTVMRFFKGGMSGVLSGALL